MTRTPTKESAASSRSAKRAGTKPARTSRAAKLLTAEELDALHDSGADLSAHVEYDKGLLRGRATQRVNVDFPMELLRIIDAEASRLGVSRQAFIKIRISDALNVRIMGQPVLRDK